MITQEFWDSLSEKGQWDIKVALRGPDSYYGETLKWFTTSVIRGYCRKIFRVGGTVNKDLKLVILPMGALHTKKSKKGWNHEHFVEHIQQAADWLKIPVLYIPAELWHEVMSSKKTKDAALTLIEQETIEKQQTMLKYGVEMGTNTTKYAELRRHFKEHLGGLSHAEDDEE